LKVISQNGLNVSNDGRTIVFTSSSIASPPELFRVNSDGSGVTPLTTFNEAVTKTTICKRQKTSSGKER
jgi:dipeptidyl aminopeptidase/acylaminoacyl peptidase